MLRNLSQRARGGANEVRVVDQPENGKTNRPDDSTERARAGGEGDQVILDFRPVVSEVELLPILDSGPQFPRPLGEG